MTLSVLQSKSTDLHPDLNLDRRERAMVASSLMNVLADSYALLINTQLLHWNVQGPLFYSIHKLTEEQYEDIFASIDDIAERVRALGYPVKADFGQLEQRAAIDGLDADEILKQQVEDLIAATERSAERMRGTLQLAEDYGDAKTADLMTNRIGQLETNTWMLRATVTSSDGSRAGI